MISSLKTKLNCSWKFRRYWNVPLVLLERSWWAGFNGIYLVRFGFRMWEILIFKWFLLLKIQINSKRLGFERKNQLKTWSHLKAYHSMQTWFPCIFCCLKNWYIHCKTMFTCCISLYVHTWANSTGHTSLSMKQGSLFVLYCFVLMRSTKPGCFWSNSWSLWKALKEEGCINWFHGVWTCGAKVLENWMISSLKVKLIVAENFKGIGMCLWCCWKDLMSRN
jgi:hypothetical protein